jgi:Negative regulator of beta-lactamase expression
MKFINKYKSPNFNNRNRAKIKFVIIHYTALKNSKSSIDFLCNKKNKVSCHFVVSQDGSIYNLVDVKKRAWHAGYSSWKNYKNINSYSIGIELDFSYEFKNNNYTKKMMFSLKKLLKNLIKKYNIERTNILSHSDIAPLRKIDPGPDFPWYQLYMCELAFYPKKEYNLHIPLFKPMV